MVWRLVGALLTEWTARPGPRIAAGLAILVVGQTAAGTGGHGVSLSRAVLGGPPVTVLHGQLQMGPGWPWLLLGLLFVVAHLSLLEHDAGVTAVTFVRGVSRRGWAVARLAVSAIGALGFLALLLAVLMLMVVSGWRPGPFVSGSTAWDLGVWALTLISLGWVQCAVAFVTTPWVGMTTAVLLLAVAVYGGNLAPFIPMAQSLVALHNLPGTLNVADGAGYVLFWTLLAGTVVWAVAEVRVGYR